MKSALTAAQFKRVTEMFSEKICALEGCTNLQPLPVIATSDPYDRQVSFEHLPSIQTLHPFSVMSIRPN